MLQFDSHCARWDHIDFLICNFMSLLAGDPMKELDLFEPNSRKMPFYEGYNFVHHIFSLLPLF